LPYRARLGSDIGKKLRQVVREAAGDIFARTRPLAGAPTFEKPPRQLSRGDEAAVAHQRHGCGRFFESYEGFERVGGRNAPPRSRERRQRVGRSHDRSQAQAGLKNWFHGRGDSTRCRHRQEHGPAIPPLRHRANRSDVRKHAVSVDPSLLGRRERLGAHLVGATRTDDHLPVIALEAPDDDRSVSTAKRRQARSHFGATALQDRVRGHARLEDVARPSRAGTDLDDPARYRRQLDADSGRHVTAATAFQLRKRLAKS
jgi:hypothetical protein